MMICFKYSLRLLAIFLSFSSILFSEGLVINEYMSSNGSTLYDEDGDTPDWIELYNASADIIDLYNYVSQIIQQSPTNGLSLLLKFFLRIILSYLHLAKIV